MTETREQVLAALMIDTKATGTGVSAASDNMYYVNS